MLTHNTVFLSNPMQDILSRSILWGTVSNALLKSKTTSSVCFPCSSKWMTSSSKDIKFNRIFQSWNLLAVSKDRIVFQVFSVTPTIISFSRILPGTEEDLAPLLWVHPFDQRSNATSSMGKGAKDALGALSTGLWWHLGWPRIPPSGPQLMLRKEVSISEIFHHTLQAPAHN